MSDQIDVDLVSAYSRGEITRRAIAERLGRVVGFGELLGQLHAHGLPLPCVPVDLNSPGVQLVKQLVEKAMARGR